MTTEGLWARFVDLPLSTTASAASAIAAEPTQLHLIIKGSQGEPILLLRSKTRAMPRAPIRLKHVRVMFDEAFEVRLQPGTQPVIGRYTKLACAAESTTLHKWFVELAGAVASSTCDEMSDQSIDDLLASLLELFRKASPPSTETILGLWGELLAINRAADAESYVQAWHTSPNEVFDFRFPDRRVEVKTTLKPTREHDFSLNQVATGREGDYVLSLIAQRATGGESVFTLAKRAATILSDVGRERLWLIVMETLGPEIEEVEYHCFDADAAAQSARLFKAGDLPTPSVGVQHQALITNVRFSLALGSLGDGLPLHVVHLKNHSTRN